MMKKEITDDNRQKCWSRNDGYKRNEIGSWIDHLAHQELYKDSEPLFRMPTPGQ